MNKDRTSKKLVTLTTIILIFPIYFLLKISPLAKYTLPLTIILAIIIHIILYWINAKYSEV